MLRVAACRAAPASAQSVSFAAPANLAVGGEPRSVAVGDFNGDSDPDLAVANCGPPATYRSCSAPRAGASRGRPTSPPATAPRSVAVGDFNGDSDPDLAVANRFADDVSILLGAAGGELHGADQLRRRHDGPLGRGGRLQRRLRPRPRGRERRLRQRLDPARRRGRELRRGDQLRAPATGPTRSRWATSTATPTPTSRSRTASSDNVSILLGAAGGSFDAATNFAVGDAPLLGRGGRLQRRLRPRPGGRELGLRQRLDPARRRGRRLHGADQLRRRRRPPVRSRWATSTATPTPTSRSRGGSRRLDPARRRGRELHGADHLRRRRRCPHSVAVGDFNGDSDPDLAVANQLSNNVSILLNTTTAFNAYVRPAGASPVRVSAGDRLLTDAPNRTAPTARRSHSDRVRRPLPARPTSRSAWGTPVLRSGSCASGSSGETRRRPMTRTSGSVQALERDALRGPVRVHGRAARLGEVRLTDRQGTLTQTTVDFPLEFDVPCVPTASTGTKSLCALTTTLDAVTPGAAAEGTRAIFALDQVEVYDGGPTRTPHDRRQLAVRPAGAVRPVGRAATVYSP